MNEFYLIALTTGLIGSLHCIGMCGPIAIALPLGKRPLPWRIAGGLVYNTGRILTYAILGGLFGLLGKGISMAGLQQWASIFIGIVMILSVLFPVLFRGKIKIDRFLSGFSGKLITQFRRLFSVSSFPSLFVIGFLNGLLPCGLVYVAIAGAINTNDIVYGMIYMIIFGAGTIPVMLAIPLLGNLIASGIRKNFKGLLSAFIVLLGILFILRGLSLGIPYVSPKTKMLKPQEQMMHHGEKNQSQDTIEMCH